MRLDFNEYEVVIVTPTFNRENEIINLAKSLRNQTCHDFHWIIVNDGSTTPYTRLKEFLKKNKKLNDRTTYIEQENKGKAGAINYVIDMSRQVETEHLFLIIDDDDLLKQKAIDIFKRTYYNYHTNASVGGVFFQYSLTSNGEEIVNANKQRFLGDVESQEIILNKYEWNYKYGPFDGVNGYFSRAFREYKYPTFSNEKYVGPTVLQMLMSDKYNILMSKEEVGIAMYRPGGLSDKGRSLRLKNPKGMLLYSVLRFQGHPISIIDHIKYRVSMWAYSYILSDAHIFLKTYYNVSFFSRLFSLPGLILSKVWMLRYSTDDIGRII